MRPATPPLTIDEGQRAILEKLAKSHTGAHREVARAEALLTASEGTASTANAGQLQVSPASVVTWRARFVEEGVAENGRVRPGRGRKPEIAKETIEGIVRLTPETTPEGETHWSCRSMAKVAGVSAVAVQRVWSPRGSSPT